MGRVTGKVAFVTGAARGQGRSHAVRLAEEGADVIALDICAQIPSVPYPMATREDLDETVSLVEKAGRRAVPIRADVRDYDAVAAGLKAAVGELGRLDIVAANAGIISYGVAEHLSTAAWRDLVDTNLTGVWHTAKAAIPHLVASGPGASIVITASTASFLGMTAASHYSSTKHGVIGLTKSLARELGPQGIRVNAICPGTVRTTMVENDDLLGRRTPDGGGQSFEEFAASLAATPLRVPYLEPIDISNALLFLTSDEARYITGVALPVDAGALVE